MRQDDQLDDSLVGRWASSTRRLLGRAGLPFGLGRLASAAGGLATSRHGGRISGVGGAAVERAGFEELEQRLFLAAVMWDGGGDRQLARCANWDNDAVPTAADDVTIPDTALAEVRIFAADAVARSLTMDADLRIQSSSTLTLIQGAVVNGTLTLGNNSTQYGVLRFNTTAQQTLGGTGQVVFAYTSSLFNNMLAAGSGVTLTIGPNTTIRGGHGVVRAEAASSVIVNQGTISADTSGRTLTIDGSGSIINTGTMGAQSGGTLSIGGPLDHTAGTIAEGSTGPRSVNTSTITGGVINATSGAQIYGAALVGVTINGDFRIISGHTLTISNGLTLNGTLTLGDGALGGGSLSFATTSVQLLGGTGTIAFSRTATSQWNAVTAESGVALTIGPNLTIRGGMGWLRATTASASIVNQGTISADIAGRFINLLPDLVGTFENQGTMQAINGGLLIVTTPILNTGLLRLSSGSLRMQRGGVLTNQPQGTVLIDGVGEILSSASFGVGTTLFENYGLLSKSGVGALTVRRDSASMVASFVNHGTILMTGGNVSFGTTTNDEVLFVNSVSGVAEVTSSVLLVRSGSTAGEFRTSLGATISLPVSFSHLAGATYTGAGTVHFSGGTHTFAAGAFTIASATIVAATLTGDGDLTFTGAVTWDNWATGAGTLTFASTATVNHIRGGYHRNTDNYGNFFWNNNDLELLGGRTFTNHDGALFEFAVPLPRPHSYIYLNSGVATFINEGTFIKSGSTSLSFPSQTGQFDFINRGVVSHNFGVNNWGRVRVFLNEPDAVLAVNAGSMHLPNASNLGTFSVAAGAQLTLPQLPVQVVGNSLVGGTWIVGGTLTFPGGTNLLSLESGASFTLDGPSANVGGALNGLTTNNGLLTIRNPGAFPFNPAGGEFFNNGTLALTGTGTFSIPPSITFNNGPSGRGRGGACGRQPPRAGADHHRQPDRWRHLDIFGTITINQNFDLFAVINLHPGGTLNGTGHITARAAFNWFGGTQSGTGSTTAAAQLTLHGTDVMTLSRVASNTFAGNWTGGCLLLAGGQFVNSTGAAFVITGTVEVVSAEEGGESFVNEGSLVFEAGSESSFGDSLAVTSTPGSETVYRAQVTYTDSHTFDGNIAVELTGVLVAEGVLTFLANFELRLGGEIAGSGTITFAGVFRWLTGSMTGTGTTIIDETAVFELDDGDKLLARTLENFSTAGNWTGGCIIMVGGIFNNRETASLNIYADPQIDVVDGGGVNEFNNDGLITVHTGEFVIGVPGTNTGTIIVIPPDTLVFAAAWTHMPGSSLEGPGGVRFEAGQHTIPAGGLNITGPITITGGAMVLAAMFMPNYNAATFTFTGGNWSVSGNGQLFLNGAEIRVIGVDTTFAIAGAGVIGALANLARVDGTLSLADGAVFTSNPNGAGGVLINNGLVTVGTGATFAPEFYQQTGSGVLQTLLTGAGAAERGYVSISGHALLAGTLRIEHAENFGVFLGQQVMFFASASTTNWFDTLSVGAPGAGLRVLVGDLDGQILFTFTHVADWNLDFAVDVQDIFAFLADWFNTDADFNGDGTTDVPDIFAFLSAWFSA